MVRSSHVGKSLLRVDRTAMLLIYTSGKLGICF